MSVTKVYRFRLSFTYICHQKGLMVGEETVSARSPEEAKARFHKYSTYYNVHIYDVQNLDLYNYVKDFPYLT